MERDGIDIEMPECLALHLAEYLFEIGPTVPAGMGAGPITHTEIRAWSENTGIELDAWEARTLRRLSIDYANESHKARDRTRPAPFKADELMEKSRPAVANHFRTFIQNQKVN